MIINGKDGRRVALIKAVIYAQSLKPATERKLTAEEIVAEAEVLDKWVQRNSWGEGAP